MSTAIQGFAEWRHGEAVVNGVRLHYVEAGTGPLVILLHGFPEFWYSWRLQIPALARAGYHVVAPDMRGYNLSEKPDGLQSYRVDELVADVAGLVRHFGEERASVVGHDWGGLVAWFTGILRPEVVDRLVVLNAPHPAAYERELWRSTQPVRSWYAGFFQLPVLPETVFRFANYAVLERVLRNEPVREGAFSDEDIRLYKEALDQPGALRSAINFYRAAVRERSRIFELGRTQITARTLLLWGERDPYLVASLTEGLTRWVPRIRVHRIAEASHWIASDAPDEVNDALIGFLGEE